MTINLLRSNEDIQVMQRYSILKITTLISSYEDTIEHRYVDTQCTAGGMLAASTIPRTIQSTTQTTIHRCRLKPLHCRVTMPNTIPYQIPSHTATMWILHNMKPYDNCLWRSNDL